MSSAQSSAEVPLFRLVLAKLNDNQICYSHVLHRIPQTSRPTGNCAVQQALGVHIALQTTFLKANK